MVETKSRGGRPSINGTPGEAGKMTWIYGEGQLDQLRAWAEKDGLALEEEIRRSIAAGIDGPFPEEWLEEERQRRWGYRPGTGNSPHKKFRPAAGQREALQARGDELGLSGAAVARLAVRRAAELRGT